MILDGFSVHRLFLVSLSKLFTGILNFSPFVCLWTGVGHFVGWGGEVGEGCLGLGCLGLGGLLLAPDDCAGGEGDLGGDPGGVLGEQGVAALARGPGWRKRRQHV